MYTIETIESMISTSKSLEEFESIKSILIDKKKTTMQLIYDDLELLIARSELPEEIETALTEDQILLLQDYEKKQRNAEIVLLQINNLITDVHMKIRSLWEYNFK